MKTTLITLLCLLISISFCFAQGKDEKYEKKFIKMIKKTNLYSTP